MKRWQDTAFLYTDAAETLQRLGSFVGLSDDASPAEVERALRARLHPEEPRGSDAITSTPTETP